MASALKGMNSEDAQAFSRIRKIVAKYPMLEKDEDIALGQAVKNYDDQDAKDRLVTSHFRLAVSLCNKYAGYGVPVMDLFEDAVVGLSKATQRYEPEEGVTFAAYAAWWARSEIMRSIMNNSHMVRVGTSEAKRTVFFNYRRASALVEGKIAAGEIKPEDRIAEMTKTINFKKDGTPRKVRVTEAHVAEMDGILSAPDSSLNVPVGDDMYTEWIDVLGPDDEDANNPESLVEKKDELAYGRALLFEAIKHLPNDRWREIFIQRALREEPVILEDLSNQYGVSIERVRQISIQAKERVEDYISKRINARPARRRFDACEPPLSSQKDRVGSSTELVL